MSQSATPHNDFPLDPSVPLESILCTGELRRRPSRPPDYERENRALVALARALVDSSSNILQTLAATILEVTACDSSGLSLLTKEDGGKRFYWPAIAGVWKPHTGGGTPRDCGPCGDALDHDCALLFRHFERRYIAFLPVMPAAEECLIVPFYVDGKAVGTMWAVMHTDRRRFDAEDERLMTALGQFAAVAYRTLASIDDLKVQVEARKEAEAALRREATGLEAKMRRFVDTNVMGIFTWNREGEIVEANERFLSMVQLRRQDLALGRMRWIDLTPAEWRARDEMAVAEVKSAGIAQPYRKEFLRADGSRVPALAGAALLGEDESEGVAFVLDLSDQEKAEEARRRVERHSRSIIDSALDAVVAMDGEGIIADWNKQAEKIFGWRREEAVGRRMSQTIIPEQHRAAHDRGLRHFLETGSGAVLNRRIEITALRRDGQEFPVELTVTPLQLAGSWSFHAFIRDITDRKRAEEALRASEQNLGVIINTIPALAWSALPDGSADFFNQHYLNYSGLSAERAQGWGWTDAVHPDDRTGLAAYWQSVVAAGKPGEYETRLRRFDGVYRWFLLRAEPLCDESGNIVKWYGTNTDIEDRKNAEEALRTSERSLRTSEQNLRLIVDTIPALVCTMNSQGELELVNRQIYEYFGKSLGELKDWSLIGAVHPDDLDAVVARWRHSVETGEPYHIAHRVRRADGVYRWFQVRGLPLRDTDGHIVRWYILLTDVEDQRRAEETLRESEAKLRSTQTDLAHMTRVMTMGELTASIAHEVNQPLAAIIASGDSCTAWLSNVPPNIEKARASADRVVQAATQASGVIQRIRTMFKKAPAVRTPLRINEVIEEAIFLIHTEVLSKGIALRMELTDGIPQVSGDRVQVSQVILNLAMNAIEAMAEGYDQARSLSIRSVLVQDGEIRVSVADTGRGLDPKITARLFDPFFTTKTGGIGMGLSISRSIIEAHGGRLWAETNQPRGSVFHFVLPATPIP